MNEELKKRYDFAMGWYQNITDGYQGFNSDIRDGIKDLPELFEKIYKEALESSVLKYSSGFQMGAIGLFIALSDSCILIKNKNYDDVYYASMITSMQGLIAALSEIGMLIHGLKAAKEKLSMKHGIDLSDMLPISLKQII